MSLDSNLRVCNGLEMVSAPLALERSHTLQATFSYTVRAADGSLVTESPELPCQSYLQGFSKVMFGKLFGLSLGSGASVPLTNGWISTSGEWLGVFAASVVNAASVGPIVGIGSVAVAIAQSSLVTQITHGTGANQLQHAAVTFAAPTVSGTATSFTATRVFTNASAGPLVVKEIGLGATYDNSPSFQTASGTYGAVLLMRDLIGQGTGVSVGSGAQMTLNINLRTNV